MMIRAFTGLSLLALLASCPPAFASDKSEKILNSKEGKPADTKEKYNDDNTYSKKESLGPLHKKEIEEKERVAAQLKSMEVSASERVTATAKTTSCSGSTCTGTLPVTQDTNTSARSIVSTAEEQRTPAEQRRSEILQAVNTGEQQGLYPPSETQRFRQLFSQSLTPTDAQILALHKKLQDPAAALRTNNEELSYIKETEEKYTKVAQEAESMEQKLTGTYKRAQSLGTNTQVIRGENSNGTLSRPAKATSVGAGRQLSISSQGSGSSDSVSDSREDKNKLDHQAKQSGGNGGARTPAEVAAAEKEEKEKVEKAKASENEAKEEKPEGEKSLNAEGKDILAGMLKELQADLRGDKRSVTDLSAGGVSKVDADGEHSIIGHAILSLATPGANRSPASRGDAISGLMESINKGAQAQADLDFLGIDRSLFTRVSERIRKKAAPGGSLE